ncbi:MAG: hypothetical protein ACOC56_02600 [Atribacterota bacterium]
MKQINIYFEDEDFKKLNKYKKEKSWRDFILLLLNNFENKQRRKGDV